MALYDLGMTINIIFIYEIIYRVHNVKLSIHTNRLTGELPDGQPVVEKILDSIHRRNNKTNISRLTTAAIANEKWQELAKRVTGKDLLGVLQNYSEYTTSYRYIIKQNEDMEVWLHSHDIHNLVTCPPKPDPHTMLRIRPKETGNAKKETLLN